jgi:ATP-dependent RNA helicase HelY
MDARALAGLAGTRTYPLRSSFKPSYNMAVNLVGQLGRARARTLLETSFAQFQADKAVVGLTRQVRRNNEALDGYREAMTCHLGDFSEYAALRRALSDRESELARQGTAARRAAAVSSLERLREGDVIVVPTGRRAGIAVVLDPGVNDGEGPRPVVLTAERQVVRLSPVDFPWPVAPIERMRVPKSFSARSPQARRDLAATLRHRVGDIAAAKAEAQRARRHRERGGEDSELLRLRKELRAHPCHGCDQREDHARWGERYHRLHRENEQLESRVRSRTHTIARTFDRVCSLLDRLGYLDGDTVTTEGRRLSRLYTELDLLVAECLRGGLFAGLGPAEFAAAVSPLVFESRQPEEVGPPRLPPGPCESAIDELMRLWAGLDEAESNHRLDFLHRPDAGFAWAAYRWAGGAPLDEVLAETGLPAGDFVRWSKQLIDLLGQIADAAAAGRVPGGELSEAQRQAAARDDETRRTANAAADALRRGVVAYSSVA